MARGTVERVKNRSAGRARRLHPRQLRGLTARRSGPREHTRGRAAHDRTPEAAPQRETRLHPRRDAPPGSVMRRLLGQLVPALTLADLGPQLPAPRLGSILRRRGQLAQLLAWV